MIQLRSCKGFTIAEIIVSSVIVVIIAAVAYNFYVLARDVGLHAYIQGEMQNEAILAMEKMIYGVDATRKGIQEAQDILIPASESSGSQIQFVDQNDDTLSRQFLRLGDNLVYIDENGINTAIISGGVQTLTFMRPVGQDDLVLIDLVLQRAVRGRVVTVNLSTSTRLRNI